MDSQFSQHRKLWTNPAPGLTRIDAFRRFVNRTHGLNLKDYYDLHKYSVTDYTFWQDLWTCLGIVYSVPPSQVVTEGRIKEVPHWFPDARFNFAENLLQWQNDKVAIIALGEQGKRVTYTFRELRALVRDMSSAMRAHGLRPGDRVAAIVANNVTAVVIALATLTVGAIFSGTATDMGTQGILDRYRQIQPKLLFSEVESVYAGKTIGLIPKVSALAKDLSGKGLHKVILLPSSKTGLETPASELGGISNSVNLSHFLANGDGQPLTFEQVPFNHPVYILYSSGTSGPPKCIVHGGGGVLLQCKKDIGIHLNLNADDVFFQYTTTGWMMWPFMLVGLSIGASVILYDGSPFYPTLKTYLKVINDEGVALLGTSPRFLSEIKGQGINPLRDIGPFESLRMIASTGAVLTAPMFEWVQEVFGPEKQVVSSSGGTDVCAAFVIAVPTLPTYAGEIQGKSLGMKVEIFDPAGRNIEHTGQAGELVCTRPHPSLPVKFWGDDEAGTKFLSAYYDVYPGVYRQGDFMAANPRTKGLIIYGRSDGVLNPSGVRFGSGEIYSVLERFTSVVDDTLCIGQRRPHELDERVLLFVKMRPGHKFTKSLEQQMRDAIKESLSARHVPKYIFEVADIPYTVNTKKIEIAVKQIVSGSTIKPSGTVANPESLQLYYKYRDLEKLVGEKAKL